MYDRGDMTDDTPDVDLPAHVLDFIKTHATLTLATASASSVPHAGTFLYVNDGPKLYIWTRPSTTTAQHVEQNPSVAFTIEDQSTGISRARGIQGTGECSVILRGDEIAKVAHLFGQKFPELAPGDTLSISFFRITPTDIDFIDNTAGGSRSGSGTFGAEFHKQRSYSVFGDLPREEVEQFVVGLQTIRAEPGDIIVRTGGPADKYLIVLEGEVEVQTVPGQEGEKLTPYQLFGEMAIIRDTPRRATVTARQPSTLVAIDKDTFRELTAQALGIASGFDEIIRRRLGLVDEG
jgi:uncharacterized protein YhbP (UPF0306 family)